MKYNLLSLAFIVDSVSCKIIDYKAESPTTGNFPLREHCWNNILFSFFSHLGYEIYVSMFLTKSWGVFTKSGLEQCYKSWSAPHWWIIFLFCIIPLLYLYTLLYTLLLIFLSAFALIHSISFIAVGPKLINKFRKKYLQLQTDFFYFLSCTAYFYNELQSTYIM